MKTHTVSDFEVIDHGVEHAQYFQGCGTAYTKYDECATGCGQSAAEAFDDCLEQIASAGDIDLTPIEQSDDGKLFTSDKAHKATVHKENEECPDFDAPEITENLTQDGAYAKLAEILKADVCETV